jgi:hypothetical protein
MKQTNLREIQQTRRQVVMFVVRGFLSRRSFSINMMKTILCSFLPAGATLFFSFSSISRFFSFFLSFLFFSHICILFSPLSSSDVMIVKQDCDQTCTQCKYTVKYPIQTCVDLQDGNSGNYYCSNDEATFPNVYI